MEPFQKIFLSLATSNERLREEALTSLLCSETSIQEGSSVRARTQALQIAQKIVSENGTIDLSALTEIRLFLETYSAVPYPDSNSDASFHMHQLKIVRLLEKESYLIQKIDRFHLPLCHSGAEALIRLSLNKEDNTPLSQKDLIVAVVSGLLTYLRQNVGSCFATAPAILIQQEQLDRLLDDLYDLVKIGILKRVVSGIEFSVPLSPSFGSGDLHKTVYPNMQIWRAPGLIKAFQSVGITLEESCLKFLQTPKTLLDFIADLLLSHLSISKKDVDLHKKQQHSLMKRKNFSGSIQLTKSKDQKAELFLSMEKTVHATFLSMTDHALIKAWEFTLASFSEIKPDFAQWNFYTSLGLHSDEQDGTGQVIYQALQGHLDDMQDLLQSQQEEVYVADQQLRATEAALKRASSSSEGRRLQAEFATRLHHLRMCIEERDSLYRKQKLSSEFFPFLIDQYKKRFQEYFQEIYDAQMHDMEVSQYDDSPAGFRLVYKHGRALASLWSLIENEEQYIDVLCDFFSQVEPLIVEECTDDFTKKLTQEITTLLIQHIRTDRFIQSAITRMKKAHSGQTKMPWAYTSGGSMESLLKAYYKKEGEITTESVSPQNPVDLLVFLLDSMKDLPLSIAEIYTEDKGMLISSPTHAFVLHPSWKQFREGWRKDLYSYTWVRDHVLQPGKKFYNSISLSFEEQQFLLEEFEKTLPVTLHLKTLAEESSISPEKLKQNLSSKFNVLESSFDGFIYSSLPLVTDADTVLYKLLSDPDLKSNFTNPLMTRKQVEDLAKALYLEKAGTLFLPFNLHEKILLRSQEIGLAPPPPILFADTNWSGFSFGFLVSPTSKELELWRVDPLGTKGMPMTIWNEWLNGSTQKKWSIYPRPFEYL